MTADDSLAMLIGRLVIRCERLEEALRNALARVAELEAKPDGEKPPQRKVK